MSSVFEKKKVGGKTVNPSPSPSPTGILPYSQSMFYGLSMVKWFYSGKKWYLFGMRGLFC